MEGCGGMYKTKFNFCPMCGQPMGETEYHGTMIPACRDGHFIQYPNQMVAAVAIVHDGQGRVLLEQRAIEPQYGFWGLPGGAADDGENIEDSCKREVFEETGLTVEVQRLLAVRGGQIVCVVFYEATPVSGEIVVSEESLQVKWFEIDEIPWDKLAFPRHKQTLEAWVAEYRK